MNQKPMIRLPTMIAWSVWESTQVLAPDQERLALGGPDNGVDLHGQVGRRGQDAVQARARKLSQLDSWPPPRWSAPSPRRSAPQGLQRRGQRARANHGGHAVHLRLPPGWFLPGAAWAALWHRMCSDRDPDQDNAEHDLDRQRGQRRGRGWLGRVIAGNQDRDRDHDGQGHSPPEHERRALAHASHWIGSTTRKAVSGSGSSATARPNQHQVKDPRPSLPSHPGQAALPGTSIVPARSRKSPP